LETGIKSWVIILTILCSPLLPVDQSRADELLNSSGETPQVEVTLSSTSDPRTLTLSQCVDLALRHNPTLAVIDHEKAIQGLEKPLARSAFLPTLDIEFSYTRFEERQRVVPAHRNFEPGVFDEDALGADLVLRLPLYQGGKRMAAYRIAELAEKGSVEQFAATRQDLVLNVVSLFYKTLQMSEVIRATEASKKAVKSQSDTTRLQVKVGRAAPLDAMKVDVRLASLRRQISSLRADRKVLLFELARVMGTELSEGDSFEPKGTLRVHPGGLPNFQKSIAAAREMRPELKLSQIRLDQDQNRLDQVRADFWPEVAGIGRYGMRSGIPYDQVTPELGNDHETAWSAGIQIDIPLFRGGATRTRLAQARLKVRQAEERLRDVKLRINEELQKAFANMEDSLNRLTVTDKSVALAQETLRIEQARYQEGKNTINDVLDAQAAMLRSDVEHSQAVVDYLLAEFEWQRAMGTDLAVWLDRGKSDE
jgi:outer membrane protein